MSQPLNERDRQQGFGVEVLRTFVKCSHGAHRVGWTRGWWRLGHSIARQIPAARDFVLDTKAGKLHLDLRENICLMAALRCDPFATETQLLERIVSPGDVVYDIGANFGWTMAVLSNAVGLQGRVHAFEPAPPALRLLRQNASTRTNVCVHGIAIGANREVTKFCVAEQLDLSSLTANLAGDSIRSIEEVEVWPLDQYIEERGLPQPNVIKCDVEGGELNVIEGARQALASGPMFVFEYVERFGRANGFDFETICRKVLGAMPAGTVCYRVTDDGKLSSELTPAPRGANNYLAVSPRNSSRIEGFRDKQVTWSK